MTQKCVSNARFVNIIGMGHRKSESGRMKGFPTIEEVEKADKEQLARWYRFLPSGETSADHKIIKRVAERFYKLGGMTPGTQQKDRDITAQRFHATFPVAVLHSARELAV